MFKFFIEGEITVRDAEAIRRTIEEEHQNLAEVSFDAEEPVAGPAVPIVELVGVAGAVASVISALIIMYVLMKDHKKEQKWTKKKLVELIEDEMVRLGVIDFELHKISNFDSLLTSKDEPCVVEALRQETGDKYKMYVFRDGEVSTLEIKQNKESNESS